MNKDINTLREEKNITFGELAVKLNISKQTLTKKMNKTLNCPLLISRFIKSIKSGESIILSNLIDFNEEEKNLFKNIDIASLQILPVKIGGNVRGMVCFSKGYEYYIN